MLDADTSICIQNNTRGTTHRKDHPQAELVIVMVLMPGALNVVQFWVLDNLLKSDAGAGETPTAPLSPGKGVRGVVYG